MKCKLDLERGRIEQISQQLLKHERQLNSAREEMTRKQVDIESQVHTARIQTEEKYRVSSYVFCIRIED